MRHIIVIFLLTSTVLFSCKKDPCKDVNCLNGACNDGICVCEIGFEGTNCETEQRQAFLGNYSVQESCAQGDFSYNISISATNGSVSEIIISNIADFNFDVVATVSGTALTIDYQTGDGATVTGSGLLENGILSINYTLTTSANQTLSCQMTCTSL